MAIQGIIIGFSQPSNPAVHLILVGRGSNYLVCEDGRPCVDAVFTELGHAYDAFAAKARQVCKPGWVSVRAIVGNNVNDQHQVTEVGSTTYAEYCEFYPQEVPADSVIRPMGTIESVDDREAEYLPGATADEIGFVHMQRITGEYLDIAQVPEWTWLDKHACFAQATNTKVGPSPTYEIVLRMNDTRADFRDAPASLQKVFAEAHEMGLVYVVFAHRTGDPLAN